MTAPSSEVKNADRKNLSSEKKSKVEAYSLDGH